MPSVKADPVWGALRRAEQALYKAQDTMSQGGLDELALEAQDLRREILALTQRYISTHATEE